jgi:hypothetical protein
MARDESTVLGMATFKTITIKCDGSNADPSRPLGFSQCTNVFSDPGQVQDNKTVRRAAMDAGWVFKNSWDYCPEHASQAR